MRRLSDDLPSDKGNNMKTLGIYSTNEFCQHIDELVHDTEKGNLALITKHDRPTFLTIPFDERLLTYGINRAVAIHLFESDIVTMSRAAKIADLSIENFMEVLGEAGIPAADYPPEDLEEELGINEL